MTDYWEAYRNFLPYRWHHRSKKQTYTVEGINSLLRHYLARLKRRTKGYSKSSHMLSLSISLLFLKLNQDIIF
jgi:insertion element IS1 protein InsB